MHMPIDKNEIERRKQRALRFARDKQEDPDGTAKFAAPVKTMAHQEKLTTKNREEALKSFERRKVDEEYRQQMIPEIYNTSKSSSKVKNSIDPSEKLKKIKNLKRKIKRIEKLEKLKENPGFTLNHQQTLKILRKQQLIEKLSLLQESNK